MPSLFRRRMRYTRLSRPGSNHSSSGRQKMTQLFLSLVQTPRKGEDGSRISFSNLENLSPHMHGQLNVPSPHRRPNNLTLVRIYDNKVLDMLEVGIKNFKSMQDFKVRRFLPIGDRHSNSLPYRHQNQRRGINPLCTSPLPSSIPTHASSN